MAVRAIVVKMAAKLETVAHDNIVSNLGKIAENINSNFCCGGILDSPRTVELTYLKKTRKPQHQLCLALVKQMCNSFSMLLQL